MDRPTRGSVLLGDRNLSELFGTEAARVRNANIIFETCDLLPQFDNRKNLTLHSFLWGLPERGQQSHAPATRATVGLAHKVQNKMGTRSSRKRHRVTIACAFVGKPGLVADKAAQT